MQTDGPRSDVLRVEALTVKPAGREPVGPLDLDVAAGGALALVGPSGAGKSLVLRGLCGLESASWRRALLAGVPLEELEPRERRRRLLYVHQEPVRFAGCVRANLERVRCAAQAELEPLERAVEWLARLGLAANLVDRDMTALSGGEASRVALVRALQMRPTVPLLDEPTAGLDPVGARAVADLCASWIAGEPGRALIVATHDLELAERLDARFLVVDSAGGVTPASLSEARETLRVPEASS